MKTKNKSTSIKLGLKELRKYLDRVVAVAEQDELFTCLKALPVAVPIRQVTHTISERRIEPVGLVQRHLIRIIHSLGGATATELDELLCIGSDRIERILTRLASFNCGIKLQNNNSFAINKKDFEELQKGKYETTVEHSRKFTVNTLTGDLLPTSFWSEHKHLELSTLNDQGLKTGNGAQLDLAWKLNPISVANGTTIIDDLIQRKDALHERRIFGIPSSAVARVKDIPSQIINDSWVLAFLLLMEDESICCYSAANLPEKLNLPGEPPRDFFECLSKKLNKNEHKNIPNVTFFSTHIPDNLLKENYISLVITPDPGVMMVTVDEPKTHLNFPTFTQNNKDSNYSQVSKITTAIVNEKLWSGPPFWTYLKLVPGNSDTAARICVLKGIKRLRNLLASTSSADILAQKIDLNLWWKSYQEEYVAGIPQQHRPDIIPLTRLSDQIKNNRHTEFVEKFEALNYHRQNLAAVVTPIATETSLLVVNDNGKVEITEKMLNLLNNAKKHVCIISPMIEDNRIMQSILENKQAKFQILTEIRERKSHQPQYRVRGWQKKDRINAEGPPHIRNLRKLVQNKIACRSTRAYPHGKLLLVDGKAAVLSSANISPNSLGGGNKLSLEAGLYIEDTTTVLGLEKLFNGLWNSCQVRQHMIEKDISITEDPGTPLNTSIVLQELTNGLVLCANIPPGISALTDCLILYIEKAEKDITLMALSFYETDKISKLYQALLHALDRGVRIRIVIRKNYFKGKDWPDPATMELFDKGMKKIECKNLHAKGILIDNHWCGLFSANINPYSLSPNMRTAHVEIGLFGLAGSPVLKPYASFLKKLGDKIK